MKAGLYKYKEREEGCTAEEATMAVFMQLLSKGIQKAKLTVCAMKAILNNHVKFPCTCVLVFHEVMHKVRTQRHVTVV